MATSTSGDWRQHRDALKRFGELIHFGHVPGSLGGALRGYWCEARAGLLASLRDPGIPIDPQSEEVLVQEAVERVKIGARAYLQFTETLLAIAEKLPADQAKVGRLLLLADAAAADQDGDAEPPLRELIETIRSGPEVAATGLWLLTSDSDEVSLALVPEFVAAAHDRIREDPARAGVVKRQLAVVARLLLRWERDDSACARAMRMTLRRFAKTGWRALLNENANIADMVRESPDIFGPNEEDRVDRILLLLNNACDSADADPEPYRLAHAYADFHMAPAMRVAMEMDDADPRPVHYSPGGAASRSLPHQDAVSNSVLAEVNAACEAAEAEGRYISPTETRAAVDRGVWRWRAACARRAERVSVRSFAGGNGSSNGHIVRRPEGRGQHGHGARAPDAGDDGADGDGDSDASPPSGRSNPVPVVDRVPPLPPLAQLTLAARSPRPDRPCLPPAPRRPAA